MRCQNLLSWVGFALLLLPVTSLGQSTKILRFFPDGCGATAAPALRACVAGASQGEVCTPLAEDDPDFDPGNPNFSPDCCEDPDFCFSGFVENDCSEEATRRRCITGSVGDPCVQDGDCDSLVCLAGDPNTLGEPCTADPQCGIFADDPNALCGPTGDGECDIDNSDSVMGHALVVNGDVALLAVVTGSTIVPQPTYRKDKRVRYDFDYTLVDLEEVVFIDRGVCDLPIQFRQQLTPTKGLIDQE